MGGRPRKPTAVLALNGAFERNPNRARIDEPVPTTTLGAAPKWLAVTAVSIWDELVAEGFWLTGADHVPFRNRREVSGAIPTGIADQRLVAVDHRAEQVGIRSCRKKQNQSARRKEPEADPFDQFK
jgi:hypothetical protein